MCITEYWDSEIIWLQWLIKMFFPTRYGSPFMERSKYLLYLIYYYYSWNPNTEFSLLWDWNITMSYCSFVSCCVLYCSLLLLPVYVGGPGAPFKNNYHLHEEYKTAAKKWALYDD